VYFTWSQIGRSLLKTCVDIWGKGEEHVRVMAFLTVRKLALVAPKTYLDTAIRVCTGAAAVMPSFLKGKRMCDMHAKLLSKRSILSIACGGRRCYITAVNR
jgi:hypothetical protein